MQIFQVLTRRRVSGILYLVISLLDSGTGNRVAIFYSNCPVIRCFRQINTMCNVILFARVQNSKFNGSAICPICVCDLNMSVTKLIRFLMICWDTSFLLTMKEFHRINERRDNLIVRLRGSYLIYVNLCHCRNVKRSRNVVVVIIRTQLRTWKTSNYGDSWGFLIGS